MAKAKVKRIATRRARDIDVTIYRIAEMQKQINLVNAKVESAIMNLGAANKRIDGLERHREMQLKENDASCTALDRLGYRIDEQDLVITKLLTDKQPAKPAHVPVRIMPVDELVEYVKLHYSDSALKKLIAALVYLA